MILLTTYKHRVQYYETDKMGITHHSNYIRWMEEARVHFLDRIGWNFAKIEQSGFTSPVVNIECEYKNSTTFDDLVEIEVGILSCTAAKFTVCYKMKKGDTVVFNGRSSHCFLDSQGKVVRIQKSLPELYNTLLENKISE